MKAKFANCALRVLAPNAVTEVLRMAESFENVNAVREFTTLLESA